MKKIISLLLLVVILSLASCDLTEIHVPYSDYEYQRDGWEIDALVEHFKDLGFENVKVVKKNHPYYRYQVGKISIGGDTDIYPKATFYAYEEVKIEYYEEPTTLTIENCPDLLTVLTTQEMDYTYFAWKYDGKYIEFDAYIDSINPYNNDIIEVAGGDYSSSKPAGLLIRVDEDAVGGFEYYCEGFDDTLKEGQNVKVIGQVDKRMSEYFKMIYISTKYFQAR